MNLLTLPTATLAFCLLIAANSHAQIKEWRSDFEAKGHIVDSQGKAVSADVVLLKESVHTKQLTIIGLQKCDDQGQFRIRCPLNAFELKLVVLPTESTAAELFMYSASGGFEPPGEVSGMVYRVGKRQSLELTVRDESGKPVSGAEVNFGIRPRLEQLFTELNIAPSNSEGKLSIDWIGPSLRSQLFIWQPDYLPWHLGRDLNVKQPQPDWNRDKVSLTVSLVKGEPLTIQWEDLRTERRGEPFAFSVDSFPFESNGPTFQLMMDWKEHPHRSFEWRAEPGVLLCRAEMTKETNPHKIRIVNSQLVHGCLRDKQTMLPLAARHIIVGYSDDRFSTSAISQADGYFQLVLPKIDGDFKFTIAGANLFAALPEPQIVPSKSLAKPLALFDSFDSSRQLVIKPEENANKIVTVVEAVDSPDSTVAWSGTALKFSYNEHFYDRLALIGYALNVPLYGESEARGEQKITPESADKPVVREIELKTSSALRGKLLDRVGQPVAWYQIAVLKKGANPYAFWTSSHGRFATSLVPQDQPLTLSAQTETALVDKARDLGEVIAVSGLDRIPFDRYPKGTVFLKVQRHEQVKVPGLDYHVDRWIHGEPMPVDKLGRRLPVLVVPGREFPIARLQLLSYVFPKDKLTIIVIHYPDDENPNALEALKAELALRKCTFSVGVDTAAKTRQALNGHALLFNFPSDEVFLVPAVDIATVRNIMLHMPSQK